MRASLPVALSLLLAVPAAVAQTVPLAPQELIARQREHTAPALLDVRTPAEYRVGHIAGALNLPVEQLAARYGVLGFTRDQPIVVYCKSGRRAARAQKVLQSLGYRQVRLLDGSMNAWQAAHRPLVRETTPLP
jgi:rhodanese-related sulfurtransferase